MNELLKVVLSLSFSGALLIFVLFFCKPLFRNRISKRWQYYIWLVVVARLLLPFTPQTSLVGTLFQGIDRGTVQMEVAPAPAQGDTTATPQPENGMAAVAGFKPQAKEAPLTLSARAAGAGVILQNLWLIWLVVALILLIRKITVYQGFVRYIRAGRAEVSDTAILDRLAVIGEQSGVKRPVELYTNSLISSPLLLGFFRPCIVLPSADMPNSDFEYILLHELTHYKRRDMFYKWLVQFTICLHWFNPLVYLMGREVSRACELACDEAVISKLDIRKQRAYGDTLINAIAAGGGYNNSLASVTLGESKELLKERLEAIMKYETKKKWMIPAAILFSVCLFAGGLVLGSYTAQPATEKVQAEQTVFSDEGLPIMNAQNRALYERYISPIAITGILYRNFSPEDISSLLEGGSTGLLNLVAALERQKMSENTQDAKVSAAFVDEVLSTRFPLRKDKIRNVCAAIYDVESDTYYYEGGLGGGPFVPVVTGSTTNGRLTTISYTGYVGDPSADEFKYKAGISGEMIIEVNGNDFKYISNRVLDSAEPQEEPTEAVPPETESFFIFTARQLMEQGHIVFEWYFNDMPYDALWIAEDAPALPLNGSYYKKVSRFHDLNALKAATEAVFTKEFCEANFYNLFEIGKFREIDGALYVGDQGGIGEGGTYPPKQYLVRSIAESQVVLTAICEGRDKTSDSPNAPLVDYSFELVLRKVGDDWKADSYYSYSAEGYRGDLLPLNN